MGTFWGATAAFVLRAAVELDLFTQLESGPQTAQELAEKIGASERGIRILCDFLTVHQFLAKSGDRYSLTPESAAFLSRKSPAFMGTIGNFLTADSMLDGITNATRSIKAGTATRGDKSFEPEHPMWVEFARNMAPMMGMVAGMVAERLANPPVNKILDIAAGHGMFGIIVGQRHPSAQIYGLDWKNVLAVAQENAQRLGVADRYHLIPGSAFDIEWGTGYDLVLIPNFLHHFDQETNIGILKKAHAALTPGGRVAVVDFVPNEDRVSPPGSAIFSMTMLLGTAKGDAYIFPEHRDMLEQAGFTSIQEQKLDPSPQTLITGTKA